MSDAKEKWMEKVFRSMKGSQRATPSPELFAKIKGQVTGSITKVVPMYQWKYAVAAAALILLVNTAALFYYSNDNGISYENAVAVDTYNQSLISTYQIYE